MGVLQYALVLVLVIFLIFVAWQLWCILAISLVNPIFHGLEIPTLSTQTCGRASDVLDSVSNWVQQIHIPKIPQVDISISPILLARVGVGLGLLAVLVLLVIAINQLLINLKDGLIELWNAFVKLITNILAGTGLIKVIETVKGKRDPHDKPKNTILILAADPTDQSPLRLTEEMREIKENIKLGKFRELFAVEIQPALRFKDFTRALLDLHPKIVHFSGHGAKTGELIFEEDNGEALPISPSILAKIFRQFSDQIECVVLNACYSDTQARAIAKHVRYVIGTNQAIADKAAIAFSVGFYQGISEGASIEKSYELGRQHAAIHDQNVKIKLRFLSGKTSGKTP